MGIGFAGYDMGSVAWVLLSAAGVCVVCPDVAGQFWTGSCPVMLCSWFFQQGGEGMLVTAVVTLQYGRRLLMLPTAAQAIFAGAFCPARILASDVAWLPVSFQG